MRRIFTPSGSLESFFEGAGRNERSLPEQFGLRELEHVSAGLNREDSPSRANEGV